MTATLGNVLNRDAETSHAPWIVDVRNARRLANEPNDFQPAYIRVQEAILRMVEGPDYAPGDKIPSERALSDMLGISRMTVRRSVDDLVRRGVLERRSTSGTHVATPSVSLPLDLGRAMSITRIVETAGARPGSRLLFFEAAIASSAIARHMRVAAGTPLIAIRRLRMANDLPFSVETSYLPAERVPDLAVADMIGDASLYTILEERYGITPRRRAGILSVAPVLSEDARLLGIEPGENVLVYRVDVFDENGRAVEHMVSINHPQRVTFTTSTPEAP